MSLDLISQNASNFCVNVHNWFIAGLGCRASAATKPQIKTRFCALKFFLKMCCHIWIRLRLLADFYNCKRLFFLELKAADARLPPSPGS